MSDGTDTLARDGIELLTPFTQVPRRSAPRVIGDVILTGRWVAQGADGTVALPVGEKAGLYLVLEGTHKHAGDNQDFGAGPDFESTNKVEMPSVTATGQMALAYGVFRYRVGPAGFNPAGAFVVGGLVEVDDAGRLDPVGGGVAIARIEAVANDVNGVTSLVLRTLGA